MECSICLESYDTKVKRPMMIECGHTFCRECLAKIKQTSNQCPFDSIVISKDFEKIAINFSLEEVLESMQKLKINLEKFSENAKNEKLSKKILY